MKLSRLICLPILLAVSLLLPGCGAEEPPVVVTKKAAPPPPTPEQIATMITQKLGLNGPLPAAGTTLPPGTARTFKASVTSIREKQMGEEEGLEVLGFISSTFEKRIKQVERAKLWHHLIVYEEGYRVLNPRSQKFKRQRDKAIIELKRPSVTLTGFMYDGRNDFTIVYMNVHMPLEDKVYEERMRPGEEIHGLKLVKVIGNNQGVTFEFIENGDIFDVYTKSAMKSKVKKVR